MSIEMRYLLAAVVLTALLRVPWLLNKVSVRGLQKISGYPSESEPLAAWARRLWYAHEDALDNLILFTPLILLLEATEVSSAISRLAAATYFWARLAHAIVYAFAIPWLKMLAYITAFTSLLVLAWELAVRAANF
jgi:uncharacterized MAPEG superfamily protein